MMLPCAIKPFMNLSHFFMKKEYFVKLNYYRPLFHEFFSKTPSLPIINNHLFGCMYAFSHFSIQNILLCIGCFFSFVHVAESVYYQFFEVRINFV